MALTKISRGLLNTGVSDSSDATAITIDSSENVTISGDLTVSSSGVTTSKVSTSSGSDSAQHQVYNSGNSGISLISYSGSASGTLFGLNRANKSFLVSGLESVIGTTGSNFLSFATNTTERMRIDSSGNVTKSNNCSFSARHSTTVSNFGINSYVQIPFDSEIYDNGSNLASSGTFTAPVTGRYLLCATVRFGSVDASATYSRIVIATSNRTYQGSLLDHSVLFSGDADYHVYFSHFIADMDANDTANVSFYQFGGSAQADLAGDESFFQGELIG